VIVTASSGFDQDRLHVICHAASSGEALWHRQFWATGSTSCHPKMSVATPTPASDGSRIFAFYSSNDLACLDLDGNLLWYRGLGHDFPNASNSLGMASSPVVVGETVIVQVESDADSFAAGLDVHTGETRWRIARPRAANWTSPIVWSGATGDEPQVLLQSSKGIDALDPLTGEVAWSYREGASTIPSSVLAGERIYVPSHGITALRPVAASESPELLWREGRLPPGTASPIVLEGRIYVINNANVLVCGNLEDGKLLWRLRLTGPFSASPVAAAGYLYFVNEEGLAQVVRPGDKAGELVSENALGEVILATPAVADGGLYVRSDGHLWKIAEP
jgi:outer membrane protein assembly factor BamB